MPETSSQSNAGRINFRNSLVRLLSRYWKTGIIVVLLFVAWEVFARVTPQGNNFFPTLGFTVKQTLASSDLLISSLQSTAIATVLAFIFSVLLGVALGVVFSQFVTVRELGMPILIFAYALPPVILAPLFLIWFGLGLSGVVIFGTWVAVFPVLLNTITGMGQTEEEFYHLAEVYGATSWQTLKLIEIWKALPHISAGAKIAVQSSIVGVIVGEFIASGSGLGFLIVLAAQRAQLGFTYGTILMLIAFTVSFYLVVTSMIDRITPHVE